MHRHANTVADDKLPPESNHQNGLWLSLMLPVSRSTPVSLNEYTNGLDAETAILSVGS